MTSVADRVEQVAVETGFSGVVRVDRAGGTELAVAYGLAHRGEGISATVSTRFGIASATKGLTALMVMCLVEQGLLDLGTTARAVLGGDLPLVSDAVTVEHLLSHRSGIGDYVDEESNLDVDDYLMPVPVHELATTEQYLRVLDGHVAKFAPGERFAYCNSGYVLLALIAERVGCSPFHDLVQQRVCGPAGMSDTAFLRSDELPGGTALGYLAAGGLRTNVLHLPVRGSGDGGAYSTVGDALWGTVFEGRIVPRERVAQMVRPRSELPSGPRRYGLGFWLDAESDAVMLEGCDAGVSFRSTHHPGSGLTHTVVSNTSEGAWPVARELARVLQEV